MSDTATTLDKQPIVVEADLFDFLELSVMEFGNIGKGDYWRGSENTPHCVVGHCWGPASEVSLDPREGNYILMLLNRYNGSYWSAVYANDHTVKNYNLQHDRPYYTSLTWEEYCSARNWVRGPQPEADPEAIFPER